MKKIYALILVTLFGISQVWGATLYGKVAVGSGKGEVTVEIYNGYNTRKDSKSTTGTQVSVSYGMSAVSWGYCKFIANASTGYAFEGWYTNSACTEGRQTDNSYQTETSQNKARTDEYWAKFTPNNYTVTYNAQGGTCSANTVVVTFDAAYGTLAIPSRDGYTFDGWFTAASGGYKVTSTTKVSTASDHTLYAHWTALSYTISFNGNGNSDGTMESLEMQFGTKKQLTANAFSRAYTVTFDADGGSCETTSIVATYTFAGWEDHTGITYNGIAYDYTVFDAPYYANLYGDLYAAFGYDKYSLIQHYVNNGKNEGRVIKGETAGLYPNGATLNNMTTTEGTTVELFAHWADGAIILPAVTKEGLILDGWFEGETRIGNPGEEYYPAADAALKARWAEKITPVFELSKTTIELDQKAVLTLTNTDQPVVEILPEGIVNYEAETGELKAIGIGEVSIKVTQAETEMLAAKQETLVLKVEKKTASLSVKLNGIAQNSIIVYQGKSATVGFVKESDAEVEVSILSGEQYAGYTGGKVVAGELGTAVFRATLPETETYKTAYADFTVTTQQDPKHVPFVLTAANHTTFEGTSSSNVSWNSNGYRLCDGGWSVRDDYRVITFAGIPDKLTFDKSLEKSLGQLPGTYQCEVFESTDGTNWGSAIWEHNERVEEKNGNVVQLSPTTRYVKFSYHGTVYCNYTNIEVTELKRFEPTVSNLNFGTGYIGEGREEKTFGLNYANAGHQITLSVNDSHFAVSPALITDAGGEQVGTKQPITVSYNTDEAHKTSNAKITISDERGNVAYVSLAAETKKHPQTLSWISGFDGLQYGQTIDSVAVSDKSAMNPFIYYTSSDSTVIDVNGAQLKALKVGKANISAFVDETDFYLGHSVAKEVEVSKIPVTVSEAPQASVITLGENLSTSQLSGGVANAGDIVVEGSFVWKEPTTVPSIGKDFYTAVFKPANDAMYEEAEVQVEVTVPAPTTYGDFEATFCQGGSVEYNGKTYTEAAQENVTLSIKNIYGGDSIVKVTITVHPTYLFPEEKTVFVGEDFEWQGVARATDEIGDFNCEAKYTTVAGCDSIYTLAWHVVDRPTTYGAYETTLCEGDSLFFGSTWFYNKENQTNVKLDEKNIYGGDSIVALTIVMIQLSASQENLEIVYGDDEAWHGKALKEYAVGTHELKDTLVNKAGCDSVVTLTLKVSKQAALEKEEYLSFCPNGQAEYAGKIYAQAGKDQVIFEGEIRDTIVNVIIAELPTYNIEEKDTVWIGLPYEWEGETRATDELGTFEHNEAFTTVAGCDSVRTLLLIVVERPKTYGVETLSFCAGGSVEYNGKTYTEAAEENVTLEQKNMYGGDSIVTLTVLVLQPTTGTAEKTIVYGAAESWNGIDLSEYTVGSHEIPFNTTNAVDCDSTVTLTLTVTKQAAYELSKDIEFCAGDSAEYLGKWYYAAGEDKLTFTGDIRDTTITVNVTVHQPSYTQESLTIVYEKDTTWNGIALNDSTVGTHIVTYVRTNATGCDSIVTLTLTVEPKPVEPDTPTGLDQTQTEVRATKVYRNGVIYIRRGEMLYGLDGKRIE